MDAQQLLMTGISAVSSALVFVCRLLWVEVKDCKKDRIELRQEVENVKTENGRLGGFLEAVGTCKIKDCTFAVGPARHAPDSPWQKKAIHKTP